jgi:hypothetical protein
VHWRAGARARRRHGAASGSPTASNRRERPHRRLHRGTVHAPGKKIWEAEHRNGAATEGWISPARGGVLAREGGRGGRLCSGNSPARRGWVEECAATPKRREEARGARAHRRGEIRGGAARRGAAPVREGRRGGVLPWAPSRTCSRGKGGGGVSGRRRGGRGNNRGGGIDLPAADKAVGWAAADSRRPRGVRRGGSSGERCRGATMVGGRGLTSWARALQARCRAACFDKQEARLARGSGRRGGCDWRRIVFVAEGRVLLFHHTTSMLLSYLLLFIS